MGRGERVDLMLRRCQAFLIVKARTSLTGWQRNLRRVQQAIICPISNVARSGRTRNVVRRDIRSIGRDVRPNRAPPMRLSGERHAAAQFAANARTRESATAAQQDTEAEGRQDGEHDQSDGPAWQWRRIRECRFATRNRRARWPDSDRRAGASASLPPRRQKILELPRVSWQAIAALASIAHRPRILDQRRPVDVHTDAYARQQDHRARVRSIVV